jgi:hypothetical protein
MTDYRSYLKAIGRNPIPPHDELRTPRGANDVELPIAIKAWWHPEPYAPAVPPLRVQGEG